MGMAGWVVKDLIVRAFTRNCSPVVDWHLENRYCISGYEVPRHCVWFLNAAPSCNLLQERPRSFQRLAVCARRCDVFHFILVLTCDCGSRTRMLHKTMLQKVCSIVNVSNRITGHDMTRFRSQRHLSVGLLLDGRMCLVP